MNRCLRLIWLLCLLAVCAACAARPDQAAGTLSADPATPDVSIGVGTTTLRWEVADGQRGQVFVAVDGEPEVAFASGVSGEKEAAWIAAGRRYVFRLYRVGTPRVLLAELVIETDPLPESPVRTVHDLAGGRWPSLPLRYALVALLAVVVGLWAWLRRRGQPTRARRLAAFGAVGLTVIVAVAVSAVPPRSLLTDQPYPDAAEYAEAAQNIARGKGYVTMHGFGTAAASPDPLPALHPPGYSLALVPFAFLDLDFPRNLQVGAQFYTLAYLLVTVGLAWRLGGPLAAAVIATLVGVSPNVYTSAALVLSDTLAATLLLLAVWVSLGVSHRRAAGVGLLSGALVLVRLNMLLNVVVLLLAQPARQRWRALRFALPGLLLLGAYQWAVFGSPLTTGQAHYLSWLPVIKPENLYTRTTGHDALVIWGDNLGGRFEEWVCGCTERWPVSQVTNLVFYPAVLLGLIWTYGPPLATVPGLLYALRHRRDRAVRLIVALVALDLAFFLVSVMQHRRYLAGAATLLLVLSAVAVARWLEARAAAQPAAWRWPAAPEAWRRSPPVLRAGAVGLAGMVLLVLGFQSGFWRPAAVVPATPAPATVPPGAGAAGALTLPPNFEDHLLTAIERPTDLAFTPDGRLLVTRQTGQLHVYPAEAGAGPLSGTLALDLSGKLCSNWERGLGGVAVDPDFARNHYLYLYYTYDKHNACPLDEPNNPANPVNRLSRFTLSPDNQVLSTTEVVLVDNIPQVTGYHNAGDLNFAPDGTLYVSVGDGGRHANALALDNLAGKILRLAPDGSAPAGNPYAAEAGARRCGDPAGVPAGAGPCAEIYAHGLRNPFRFAFHPSGGAFYINDVGEVSWEEINLGQRGANYGWNVREGPCPNPGQLNCALGVPSGFDDPLYYYQHDTGCLAITGSAFVPSGLWPAPYDEAYLFGDFGCGQIWRLVVGRPYRAEPFAGGLGAGSLVSMVFGPWGESQALYYATHADGGQIHRVVYHGDVP